MEEWRWYQSVEWWINIVLFSPRYIGHDTSNVRKIYRILWKGITMISIRRHDRIEKCCQRERSNYVVNSVVGFWNRRTWSGKRSERRKEGKEKTAEGCRKRVDGGKKRRGGNEGWVYVTGDRMRQLLNGWLTDEEHDRLIRLGEGEKIVFRCFPRDVSLAGPRSAWFRRTLLPVSTSRSRSSNSILYPPVDACRLSQLWYAPGNTYEHIVWTSSK